MLPLADPSFFETLSNNNMLDSGIKIVDCSTCIEAKMVLVTNQFIMWLMQLRNGDFTTLLWCLSLRVKRESNSINKETLNFAFNRDTV